MNALQRLAEDLALVAARRWFDFGMNESFVWGKDTRPHFEPLDWLREDRPRLRMSGGFDALVTTGEGDRGQR